MFRLKAPYCRRLFGMSFFMWHIAAILGPVVRLVARLVGKFLSSPSPFKRDAIPRCFIFQFDEFLLQHLDPLLIRTDFLGRFAVHFPVSPGTAKYAVCLRRVAHYLFCNGGF